MAETTGQKIVRLETQMTDVKKEITEVKGMVQTLINKVDNLALIQTQVSALQNEIDTLKNEITALKGVNNLKNTLLWVGLVASAIINVVVIYQLFTKE